MISRFCKRCGKKLLKVGKYFRCPDCEIYCESCGSIVKRSAKKCSFCGERFDEDTDSNKRLFAVFAVSFGIFALFLVGMLVLPLILGLVAVILGIIGLYHVKPFSLKRNSLAIAGIVLGVITILIRFSLIGSDSLSQETQTDIPLNQDYPSLEMTKLDKVRQINEEYHQTHTYTLTDLFVCTDMSIEMWNLLKTQGIDSKICAGNINTKYTNVESLMRNMNHAWVIAETEPLRYVAVETTGGYLVWGSGNGNGETENDLYYSYAEFCFDNPKNFKSFIDLRTQYLTICDEAKQLQDYWNTNIVGTQQTSYTDQYKGRMDAKTEECNQITAKLKGVLG